MQFTKPRFSVALATTLLTFALVQSHATPSMAQSTLFAWDFESTFPAYNYSHGYAGQGAADCVTNVNNSSQVSADHGLSATRATSQLTTNGWKIEPDACWTYTGWEFGLGHLMQDAQQLTSADLSKYRLNFDAWILGTDPLPSILQVHFQDDSALDENGNATTRVVIGNNRTIDDGDRNPLVIGSAPRSYSLTLDQLGFADFGGDGQSDYSQEDLNNYYSSVSSLIVELEPQGTSGVLLGETDDVVGRDSGNMLYMDNVSLQAPFQAIAPVVRSTVFEWNFDSSLPSYTYANGYAGQGLPDCETNVNNTNQVSASQEATPGHASVSLNTTNWQIEPNACWTYAGWEFGLGHILEGSEGRPKQQFASDDLSLYELSFDAWADGTAELPAVVQLHLQDNSELDANGNPVTRVVLGNNRELADGDVDPFLVDSQRRNFTVSLDALGFGDIDNDGNADFSQSDLSAYFASITSMNIEIEPQGTAGVLAGETAAAIGFDADNVFHFDNVRFTGPLSATQTPSSLCDAFSNGDTDGNGTVDFADFLTLAANFGNPAASHNQGDFNCSGSVDFADFLVLSKNFGQSAVAAQAVPEPSSLKLIALLLLPLITARRERVRNA